MTMTKHMTLVQAVLVLLFKAPQKHLHEQGMEVCIVEDWTQEKVLFSKEKAVRYVLEQKRSRSI
jgi:hypothetical protein